MQQTTAPTTATDRQARLERSREAVDAALERLAENLRQGRPEDLVAYLAFASRFRRYSFTNSLLIQAQRPGATQVAGFRAWQRLGRSVRKGERGIGIVVPYFRKRQDADEDGSQALSGFGLGHVFDVAQTEGEALPEMAWRTPGPAHDGDIERLAHHIRASGIGLDIDRAAVEAMVSGADGATWRDASGGLRIAVSPVHDPAQTVRTLLHEWGHALLHFGSDRPEDRMLRELEADATAVAAAAGLGYDFGEGAWCYLAGWNATPEGLALALPRILKATRQILSAVGLDQDAGLESTP